MHERNKLINRLKRHNYQSWTSQSQIQFKIFGSHTQNIRSFVVLKKWFTSKKLLSVGINHQYKRISYTIPVEYSISMPTSVKYFEGAAHLECANKTKT